MCAYSNLHLPLEAHEQEDSTQLASALIRIRAAARANLEFVICLQANPQLRKLHEKREVARGKYRTRVTNRHYYALMRLVAEA